MIAVWGIALVELVTVVGWTVSQTDTIAVARNKIEKLGGQIEIDGDTNEVKAIRLRSERISDKDLELLMVFPRLAELNLALTSITDQSANRISQLSKLRKLNLDNTKITDGTLRHLLKLPLETISLAGTEVSDEGMRWLAQIRTLERINLSQTKISNTGLERLSILPELKQLYLTKTKISGGAIALLSQAATDLDVLECSGTQIDNGSIATFPSFRRLRRLGVARCQIRDEDLKSIGKCRNLDHLELGDNSIGDKGVGYLKELTKLQDLGLTNTLISNSALRDIGRFKTLTSLNLTGTNIDDDGLPCLVGLQDLQSLTLTGCRGISNASLNTILAFPKLENIEIHKTRIKIDGYQRLEQKFPKALIK